MDTQICQNCGNRVAVHFDRCPHCGHSNAETGRQNVFYVVAILAIVAGLILLLAQWG